MLRRIQDNPIISTKDIAASHPSLRVVGAFNPGACIVDNEVVLVIRVAEMVEQSPEFVRVLLASDQVRGEVPNIREWRRKSHRIDDSDPRHIMVDGNRYLTSQSHFRIARSLDGVKFQMDPRAAWNPEGPQEIYGIEDPRVSRIGDTFHILYTAVGPNGFGVAMATSADMKTFRRQAMVLPPENKDACLFPRRIRGHYHMLHRPCVSFLGRPSIWHAQSPDLLHWGAHSCILAPRDATWTKIGAGPEPLETDRGWLVLYHACDANNRYSMHACLLDTDDPTTVIGHSTQPVLTADLPFEREGFFGNVVFSNGWVQLRQNNEPRLLIYYGAADSCVGVAETTVSEIIDTVTML